MAGLPPTNTVEVNYCVVCGSDTVDTTLRTDGSDAATTSLTIAQCRSCHSRFRCNTTVSSDPTTETRPRRTEDDKS